MSVYRRPVTVGSTAIDETGRPRHPSDRAGRPDLEMRRSLTPRHDAIDGINHTLAKIGRERFRRVSRPPSPANTMNQKPPDSGILKAILSGREMLWHFRTYRAIGGRPKTSGGCAAEATSHMS
jgi:hypothetical protein